MSVIRKTKWCQNVGMPRHLRGNGTNKHYCPECLESIKSRLATIEQQGGAIEGLRGARMLAGGSFGYERTAGDKERNLNAFFFYVMPHIPTEKALVLSKQIAHSNGSSDMIAQGNKLMKVQLYDPTRR